MQKLAMLVLGFVLGVGVSFAGAYYFYETDASKFIADLLSHQEKVSVEAFNHQLPVASISAQANYLVFIERARKAGLISEADYEGAVTLANTRLCINYEDEGDAEKAGQFCKRAVDDLSRWGQGWDFAEFKQAHLDSRNQKQIPDFSLAIIAQP